MIFCIHSFLLQKGVTNSDTGWFSGPAMGPIRGVEVPSGPIAGVVVSAGPVTGVGVASWTITGVGVPAGYLTGTGVTAGAVTVSWSVCRVCNRC